MEQVQVDHFSDILCIWAYVAQIRMEELETQLGDKVFINYHQYPVFGDVAGKIAKSWAERGGIAGYNQHVNQVAEKFEHINIHPQAWEKAQPKSSLPAHLYLAAVKLAEHEQQVAKGSRQKLLQALRRAFFVEAMDISAEEILDGILEEKGLPVGGVRGYIKAGSAYGVVCGDMQKAMEMGVNSSPTLIFNEGRQKLAGNVGYRIIEANIRELLENSVGQQSWC